jgi:hypothetical protein
MCRSLLGILFWVLSGGALQADGWRVLAEKQAGACWLVLSADPSLLRAGLADFSLFSQHEGKGWPVLHAKFSLRLNMLTWWPVVALMPLYIRRGSILKKRRAL